jgi:MFS family permease
MRGLAGIVAARFLAQAYGALSFNCAAVYGPTVTRALGIAPQSVGVHFALGSIVGVSAAFLLSGVIHRFGPLRMIQGLMVLGSIALAIAASGSLPAVVFASLLVGGVGGLSIPAASLILARVTPPQHFGLVFSLKQAGAPIGIGVAGAAIPALLLVMSWQASLLVLAAAGIVVALMLQPLRAALDRERNPAAPFRSGALLAPLAIILADPRLRGIAFGAFILCAVQMSLVSYLVSYLHLDLGYSLLAAGSALTATQVSSVLARLVWGVLMDRLGNPLRVLGFIAIVGGLFGVLIAAMQPGWPFGLVVAIVVATSFAALGWNGMYLGGIARLAPRGEVVQATAGAQVFLYCGTIVGPLAFAGVVSLFGGYAQAFLACAGLSLIAGIWMVRSAAARGMSASTTA